MKFLVKPWAHDAKSNRFTSTALNFGAITQIVPTLNRPRFAPLDQGETLRCAAYAAVINAKYIHREDFSVDWQEDKISRLQGKDVDVGGSEPNAAMNSQTYTKRGGYLLDKDWSPSIATSLDEEAMNYSNSGYIKPNGGKDVFDSICIELQRHYNFETKKGACVQMFTGWYSSFSGGDVTTLGNLLGYHSYLAIDFNRTDPDEKKHYLVIQNSYGENIGDKGFHKFYRPLVNALLAEWGTSDKIPSPLTKEQIALASQQSIYGNLQRQIINIIYQITLYLVQLYGKIKHA